MARPIDERKVDSVSAACVSEAVSVCIIGMSLTSFVLVLSLSKDEREASRRFEQRDRVAKFSGASCALVMDRFEQRVPIESGQLRERGAAFFRREPRVARDATRGRFVERADRRGMERIAAAMAQCKLSGAANLLGERSTRRLERGGKRSKTDTRSPQRQADEREREHDNRAAVAPRQGEQRRV